MLGHTWQHFFFYLPNILIDFFEKWKEISFVNNSKQFFREEWGLPHLGSPPSLRPHIHMYVRYIFSSNNNIHKSLCGLYFLASDQLIFIKILQLKGLKSIKKGHTNCYECCDLMKKIRSVTNYRLVVVLVLILTKCFAKLQRSFKNSGKKCHSLALNISYCSTFDFPTPRKDKCIVVLDIFFSSNHNIHKSLCDLSYLGPKPFNQ